MQDAGLFHSVYGTEGFQGFCLPYERWDDVRALVGAYAERLVWTFCVVDRLSVDNDLDDRTKSWLARPELGRFDVDASDGELSDISDDADVKTRRRDFWHDFITLTLADWLEQVEGASRTTSEIFEWFEPGDAWGYRRGAYARMVDIVAARYPKARVLYDAVYAREGEKSKGVRQPITPPMSEAARRAREGMEQVEPRFP